MRLTIIAPDGLVGVDGEFRPVDLADLDPAIHAVHFDTEALSGHVEYKASATVEVEVRDETAERSALMQAGTERARLNTLKAVTKKTVARRGNEALFNAQFQKQFAKYIARWRAAGRETG